MSDYKDKFERWQKKATEKFEEIDAQLGIKEKIEESARVVVETAKTGAERIKTEAERTEAGKQAAKVAGEVINTASDTAKTAWKASVPLREAAEVAGSKAGDVVADRAEVIRTQGGVRGAPRQAHVFAKIVGQVELVLLGVQA